MNRQPARTRQVRTVAMVGVPAQGRVAELGPPVQRGRLARLRQPQAGRQFRVRRYAGRVSAGQPAHAGAGGVGRPAPAVPPPSPVERRVHAERLAVVLAHPARRDRVRRAGADQAHPLRQRRRDPLVPFPPVRAEVGGDVHRRRPDLAGDAGDDVLRPAPQQDQPPVQGRVERAQGAIEERQPGSPARPAQRVVEHEQCQHPVAGGVTGRQQGRVVPEPQIPTEPQHTGHSGDRTAGAARSPVGGTRCRCRTSDDTW